MADLLYSEDLRSRSTDVCDFCQRIIVVDEKSPHVCAGMPIERVLAGESYTDYGTLVSCFGEIVVEVSDDDYQGDTRYLLKGHDGRWGVLVNGWGSCSGCDALQACGSPQEYDELRKSLGEGVTWFVTSQECVAYLTGKDWEAHHSYREVESRKFVEDAVAVLSNSTAKEPNG